MALNDNQTPENLMKCNLHKRDDYVCDGRNQDACMHVHMKPVIPP